SSLHALKTHLFELGEPPAAALDDSVALSSWPGEARECVEIARGVQAEAARGVPFDRMAVFLRSPAEYRPHLEEAFRRASIPAFFARGTARPDPAGRALLALLACKTERLSARRFAEYVSLAQVPDPGAAADAHWTPPEDDLLPLPPPPEPSPGRRPGASGSRICARSPPRRSASRTACSRRSPSSSRWRRSARSTSMRCSSSSDPGSAS